MCARTCGARAGFFKTIELVDSISLACIAMKLLLRILSHQRHSLRLILLLRNGPSRPSMGRRSVSQSRSGLGDRQAASAADAYSIVIDKEG